MEVSFSKIFASTHGEINIHLNLDPNPMTVNAVPSDLERIFFNIFINAGHAMDGHGNLYVNTEKVGFLQSRNNGVNVLDTEGYIKVRIRDTGKGMDDITRQQIFKPHFTTKKTGKGLGLAITSDLIKKYSGTIEVRSKNGKGCTFDIYLPHREAPTTKDNTFLQNAKHAVAV